MIFLSMLDYAFQAWKMKKDLMMTKQETKEESKSTEGDPQMKSRIRQMRSAFRQKHMLNEVISSDVILTNPTHYAVALKYDPESMGAPRLVAKGARLIAKKIRRIAEEHRIPIIENKPLARMLYKHGQVGGEIPAELYAAVAEILVIVYRMDPYKFYRKKLERVVQD